MTNKGILYLILGGLSLIGGVIALTEISSSEDYAKENLLKDLNENDVAYAIAKTARDKLDDDLAKADAYVKEEAEKISEKVNEWKKNNEYNKKISSYQKDSNQKLLDFQTAIGYEDELSKIDKELEDAIESVKDTLGYDEKVNAQKKLIADAQKAYDTAVFFMEDNSASKDAKKAVRKAKDKTVDTANEKIEELGKLLNKETKSLKRDAKEKKQVLEGRVTAKKHELDNELEKKTEGLNKSLADARSKIIFEVEKERPDAIKQILENRSSLLKDRNDLEGIVQKSFDDAYNKLSKEDKLALYLKAKNIKAPIVGIIGTLVGLPIFICAYEYILTVVRVIEKVML